jgi:hypothetical protein
MSLIVRFTFKTTQEYQKACDLLDKAIKEIGTSHFDHGKTPADKEVRVFDLKDANIVEGLFEKNHLKYVRTNDETSWIGPKKGLFEPIQELGETLRNGSHGNLMLIENSVRKIEISIKNIIEWSEDIEDKNLAQKIKSNADTVLKEIKEIKKEYAD